MADEKQNIQDTTKQGKLQATIYKILIGIAIAGLVTAASRSETISMWISGWSK